MKKYVTGVHLFVLKSFSGRKPWKKQEKMVIHDVIVESGGCDVTAVMNMKEGLVTFLDGFYQVESWEMAPFWSKKSKKYKFRTNCER